MPRAAAARARSARCRPRRATASRSTRSRCCRRSPGPGKIVCIGLNYRSHAEEAGLDPPETPTFFAKCANALAAPGAEVRAAVQQHEGGLRGRGGVRDRRSLQGRAEEDAMSHVAGYTLLNDLSARDFQFTTPQWMPGKVFDGSAPLRAGAGDPRRGGRPRRDRDRADAERRGDAVGSTADLIHSVPALVAHLSQLMTLEPGDIVATGTPVGRRQRARPARVAEAGDEVVDQLAAARRARVTPIRLAGRRPPRRPRGRRLAEQVGVALGGPDAPRVGPSRRRPRPRAAPPFLARRSRPAATAWSRLRSSCSARRIMPQSTQQPRAVALALERARARRRRARPCGASARSARSAPARAGVKPGRPEFRIR